MKTSKKLFIIAEWTICYLLICFFAFGYPVVFTALSILYFITFALVITSSVEEITEGTELTEDEWKKIPALEEMNTEQGEALSLLLDYRTPKEVIAWAMQAYKWNNINAEILVRDVLEKKKNK